MKGSAHRRRPDEAIRERSRVSADCETRVRKALTRLLKTGAPFTVQDVCTLSGVGKTFIYDKRRADLTRAVLEARDASQAAQIVTAELGHEKQESSWRERAISAEALAVNQRARIKALDERISDLTGELYTPDGHHLAEKNADLRALVATLTRKLSDAETEVAKLRRSLDAARANVARERERNVALLPTASSDHTKF